VFYEMRVKEVADKVIAAMRGQDPITKNHIASSVDYYAQGNIHYKSSEESKREFLTDITELVKKEIKVTPKKKPFRAKNNDEFLRRVSNLIASEVGASFPDGDPIDNIAEKIDQLAGRFDYNTYKHSHFVTDIDDTSLIEILDVAAKKFMAASDYYSYVDELWQSHTDNAQYDYDNEVKRKTAKAQEHLPFGATVSVDSLNDLPPRPQKNPWRESLGEALEEYNNNVQLAIADIGQIPEDEAKDLAKKMSLMTT